MLTKVLNLFASLITWSVLVSGSAVSWLFRELLRGVLLLRFRRRVLPLSGRDRAYFRREHPADTFTQTHFFVAVLPKYQTLPIQRENVLKLLKQRTANWNNNDKKLPLKFRSRPITCCGYAYWLEDLSFTLERLVVDYSGTVLSCMKSTCGNQYSDEIWSWYCCSDGLVFRIHHCLLDGVSAIRFVLAILGDDPSSIRIGPCPKRDLTWRESLRSLYHLFPLISEMMLFNSEDNPFIRTKWTGERDQGFAVETITLQRLRSLGQKFEGATINDLMLACTARVLQKLLSSSQEVLDPRKRFHLSCLNAASMHNREEYEKIQLDRYLGNCLSGFSTTLPMAQGLKPSDFIQAIKLETSKIKESTKIYTPAHLACTYNLLPTLVTAKFSGIASTSTPGPTERFTILGGREVDRFFTTGMIPTNCGGLIVGWSRYSEHVSVTVSVDGSVLQLLKTTTEQILDTFLQQLLELENYHPV